MTARDMIVVQGQLGRTPRPLSAVAARCPFGWPAVTENLPYDPEGRPFPTLCYCTCPTLVAAVGTLESAGGVSRWGRNLTADPALMASLLHAAASTRQRRLHLVRSHHLGMLDGGASLATGVGGVADVRMVKCLHAHVAHALAHPGYSFGASILAAVLQPWCADRRCDAFLGDDRLRDSLRGEG